MWMVSQLPGAIPPYAPESVGGTDVRRYSAGRQAAEAARKASGSLGEGGEVPAVS